MSAFTTSGTRKEDISTKLKEQHHKSNMSKMKEETKNLEEESRKMEDRLKELKMGLHREKEDRQKSNFTGYWKTGALGKLSSHGTRAVGDHAVEQHKKQTKQSNKKPVIKILRDEPLEKKLPKKKPAAPGTLAFIAQRGNSGGEASIRSNKMIGPACGQCEVKVAAAVCVDCRENYCSQCFASFHLKGALKEHRPKPIGSLNTPRTPRGISPALYNQPPPPVPHTETNPMKVTLSEIDFEMTKMEEEEEELEELYDTGRSLGGGDMAAQGGGGDLLNGEYNEDNNAADFQQALKAWRGESNGHQQQQPQKQQQQQRQPSSHASVVSADTSTGMDMHSDQQRVDIQFKSNLSYAEKLLLKKHRRTDIPSLSSSTPRSPISNGTSLHREDSDTSTLRESSMSIDDGERVDFSAISSAVASLRGDSRIQTDPEEEERPESSVSIVEWNEVPRRKGRGMEQSSAYQVTEMADYVDYSAIPNEWKHPDDRKIAFGESPANDVTITEIYSARLEDKHTPTPPSTPKLNSRPANRKTRVKTATKETENQNKENVEKNLTSNNSIKQPNQGRMSKENSSIKAPKKSQEKSPVLAKKESVERSASPRKTWTKDFTIVDDFQRTLDELRKKEEEAERQKQEKKGAEVKKENKGAEVKKMETKEGSEKKAPTPRPQSKSQKSHPVSARSRPVSARSRPNSARRPKSRAQTRLELFGEGTLTKGPSENLKQIANMTTSSVVMTPRHEQTSLSDFFLAGVKPPPQEPRTLTPTNMKKNDNNNNKAFKISNKVYQLGPRSWRPDFSLGENVPETEAVAHLDEMMPTYRDHLAPENQEEAQEAATLEERSRIDGVHFSLTGGVRATSGLWREEEEEERNRRPHAPPSTPFASASASEEDLIPQQDVRPKSNSRQRTTTPRTTTPRTTTPRATTPRATTPRAKQRQSSARQSQKLQQFQQPLSSRPSSVLEKQQTARDTLNNSSRPQSRAFSRSGRESTIIVVDGDDMSCYDEDITMTAREAKEDEQEVLHQLEWELASQTGRVQEDGSISRLEPEGDDDTDDSIEEVERNLVTPDNRSENPGFDIESQLKPADLEDDFNTEFEEQMGDERDVKALH